MMKLLELFITRVKCMKLVRQITQLGGLKSGHWLMLELMRNSARLMTSRGRLQRRNMMTMQTRTLARFISLWESLFLLCLEWVYLEQQASVWPGVPRYRDFIRN